MSDDAPAPLDPRIATAARAANDAIGWTFKQTADLVVSMLLFATCVAYGGYQVMYADPRRAEEWKAADERHAATYEKIAAGHDSALKTAIEHGEKQADKHEKFLREMLGKPVRNGAAADGDPGAAALAHGDSAGDK